jgi:hypothetical protein
MNRRNFLIRIAAAAVALVTTPFVRAEKPYQRFFWRRFGVLGNAETFEIGTEVDGPPGFQKGVWAIDWVHMQWLQNVAKVTCLHGWGDYLVKVLQIDKEYKVFHLCMRPANDKWYLNYQFITAFDHEPTEVEVEAEFMKVCMPGWVGLERSFVSSCVWQENPQLFRSSDGTFVTVDMCFYQRDADGNVLPLYGS